MKSSVVALFALTPCIPLTSCSTVQSRLNFFNITDVTFNVPKDLNRDEQNTNKEAAQLIGQQLNQMLVIFLYMEVLLFSNQKVPYKACEVSKPTSFKNAQHQNQLRCWSTEAPVLFVFINVFDHGCQLLAQIETYLHYTPPIV